MKIYALKNYTLSLSIFVISFLIMNASSFAQITRVHTIDILKGMNDNTIHVKLDTAIASEEIEKMFDGNPLTAMAIQNIGTLTVTLQFDESVEIDKSKLYMWIDGIYDLEAANSEYDLNNQSGTYQLLVTAKDFSVFKWDSTEFGSMDFTWVRLILKNPDSSGIFVGEWELSSQTLITSLAVFPNPIKISINHPFYLIRSILFIFKEIPLKY